ncbi:MAG: hypothetical protein EHM28_06520 [Spirochaetaceae bacterium]|nr:MAG: hypothetical protein EHM28_06520 [Spirochaetaceae bacterium]
MRNIVFVFSFAFMLITTSLLCASPQAEAEKANDTGPKSQYAYDQRDLGVSVLKSIVIADGKVVFRSVTGGCTDRSSFRIDVKKETGYSAQNPMYVLTIMRVRPDDCKAFFPEGVEISFDLEKDLGLTGWYTILVTNPVSQSVK